MVDHWPVKIGDFGSRFSFELEILGMWYISYMIWLWYMRSSHFWVYNDEILSNAKNQSEDGEYVARQLF